MEAPCFQNWYRNIKEVFNKNRLMSKQTHLPPDVFGDDIFLLIFYYLDEEDLENCGKVCLEWQKLIQSHTWKKRLQNKRKHYPAWQTYWKRIEMNKNLCFLENSEKYKIISKETKILHNNWWSRNYVLQLHSCSFYDNLSYFFLDENFLVMMCLDNTIMILDRSTMTLKHKITECKFTCLKIKNGIIMCAAMETIKFYNLVTGEQIDEFVEPNGWPVKSVCFGYKGLAVALSSNVKSCQLTFWMMDGFCKTYLDHLRIPVPGHECSYVIWMDEHFVIVLQLGENLRTVFIVSIKTRTIVEKLSDSSVLQVRYEQGLLLMKYSSFIRVGVLSHLTQRPIQYFLDLAPFGDKRITYAINSKYLALVTTQRRKESFVSLYDIRSIKEKSHSCSALLFLIPLYVRQHEMDETQLVFFGRECGSDTPKIGVLDFGRIQPFCQQEPKSKISQSVYMSMNWKIHDYVHENSTGRSIERKIPVSICITIVPTLIVNESIKWYDSYKWPLVLSAYSLLAFLLIKCYKK